MNILKDLNNRCNISQNEESSNFLEINKLKTFSQIDVPKEFLNIISEMSEVEINIDNYKYLRLWGAEGCIEMNSAYEIQRYIPNSLAIGDNEEGSAILYVNHNNKFGIYKIDFNDLDIEELSYVSKSLFDLLVNGIGLDII
ncbi:SMI1/KNR4 family protein [uncultured Tyzzerella sp.]|uniref:SMI1/KNR4 family protein n=1 Tax=uncultured Tyzzerella sp. TaxID=2321398 RepID=UPI002941D22D|nr:SMI1/KNR4 family protein [uncultured Tyzzerella sp.]